MDSCIPACRKGNGILSLSKNVKKLTMKDNEELTYRSTHANKCVYYSIFSSDQRKVAELFRLGLLGQVEALVCLVHCNGPDKLHHFFKHLIDKGTLPTDILPVAYIAYSLSHGTRSVMSTGNGISHQQPHWRKPYLKAEMMYGLRVILSITEDINNGSVTR